MKHITLLVSLFSILIAQAQSNYNSESLIVTKADLESHIFESDSTANALVIYETGNSYIDKQSFNLKTQISRKLKILNRNGFDQATITIYLYNNDKRRAKVSKIKATTYNLENGNVTTTQLRDKDIFKEKYNDSHTLVKFTFPNIKEGSVINYSYTLDSPFKYNYKSWDFQSDIPKLYSEYRTSIPGNWEYNIKLVGGKELTTNTSEIKKRCLEASNGASANCVNSLYVMKDIPAFIDENYMTTRDNYLARIEYELKVLRHFDGQIDNITKTWKHTDKELKSDLYIGKQLKKSGVTKGLLNDEIVNETDLLKKANAIYRYVQETYVWNHKYRIFSDVSVKNLVKNKSGNILEINILLHNLLQANGIKVKPVLLSTRDNGLPTRLYPVISEFNYLIVQVEIDNKTYLLDATDDYVSFGELPFRCLNQYGRLLDFKDGSYWIDIKADKLSTIQFNVKLNLNENEALVGTIESKTTGYHAQTLKKRYFGNEQNYLDYYTNKYNSIDFLDHKVNDKDKNSFEFSETFNVSYAIESVGDNLYINPFMFPFFTENPFKLQERSYPIDFGYKDSYGYSTKITLNDAYEIVETPKNITFRLPNNTGTLIFTSHVEGNSIITYFKFNFKEAIYDSNYYDVLKKYLAHIIDIQKNALIIVKKK